MRILHHSPQSFPYHIIRPLYLVDDSMTGVCSGIQWKIVMQDISVYPFPLPLFPPPPPPAPATSVDWVNLGSRSPGNERTNISGLFIAFMMKHRVLVKLLSSSQGF